MPADPLLRFYPGDRRRSTLPSHLRHSASSPSHSPGYHVCQHDGLLAQRGACRSVNSFLGCTLSPRPHLRASSRLHPSRIYGPHTRRPLRPSTVFCRPHYCRVSNTPHTDALRHSGSWSVVFCLQRGWDFFSLLRKLPIFRRHSGLLTRRCFQCVRSVHASHCKWLTLTFSRHILQLAWHEYITISDRDTTLYIELIESNHWQTHSHIYESTEAAYYWSHGTSMGRYFPHLRIYRRSPFIAPSGFHPALPWDTYKRYAVCLLPCTWVYMPGWGV